MHSKPPYCIHGVLHLSGVSCRLCPKSKPARKLGAMNWIKHCILANCPTNRPATRVRNGGTMYGVSTGLARGEIVYGRVVNTELCMYICKRVSYELPKKVEMMES